jgi:iron complex outermembrane recepter protein
MLRVIGLCRFLGSSALAVILSGTLLISTATAQARTFHFDIPEKTLSQALRDFGRVAGQEIVFTEDLVAGLNSAPLRGDFTADGALELLLRGTRLTAEHSGSGAVMIRRQAKATSPRTSSPHQTSSQTPGSEQSSAPAPVGAISSAGPDTPARPGGGPSSPEAFVLADIVVTGTLLHSVAPITPVVTITSTDMENQGYTTLTQVIEQLPQNFKAGASTESNPVSGAGNNSANNITYATGVNLRGLGASATLVLLNGRRLAPTAFGTVVDVSQIPINVVDRIEILPGGASALYGSDAVAGVVNVITKKDFSGLEVGGRTFSVTDGKAPNYGADIAGGSVWGTGSFVASASYERDSPLLARNRSFTESSGDQTTLFPSNEGSSVYAALQQRISDAVSLNGDALATHRHFSAVSGDTSIGPPNEFGGTVDELSVALELDWKLSPRWNSTLIGQLSREADSQRLRYPGFAEVDSYDPLTATLFSLEPRVDGPLFEMPGGAVRVALGGQVRTEKFEETRASGGLSGPLAVTNQIDQSRHVSSAYGELLIPIVGSANATAWAKELRLDLSGRYDHYSDFGGTTNPKLGIAWVPAAGVTLHASYARSFQAPTLWQKSNAIDQGYVLPVPDPKSVSGSSLILEIDGTNPDLGAETARSFNGGVTFQPEAIAGLRVDASYFSIDFSNQINRLIADGYFLNVLQEEAVLGSFVQRNPTASAVQALLDAPGRQIFNWAAGNYSPGVYTAADIQAIANIGYVNAAVVRARGLDFRMQYTGPSTSAGRFRGDVDSTYFTSYRHQVTPQSLDSSPLNTVLNPLRFRAKANVGWEIGAWVANARANYANAYLNTNAVNPACSSGGPDCQIASWFTTDLSVSYRGTTSGTDAWSSGLRISVDVENAFNRKPPFLSGPPGTFHYDPTNSSAGLRMWSLSVSKRWGQARR